MMFTLLASQMITSVHQCDNEYLNLGNEAAVEMAVNVENLTIAQDNEYQIE